MKIYLKDLKVKKMIEEKRLSKYITNAENATISTNEANSAKNLFKDCKDIKNIECF